MEHLRGPEFIIDYVLHLCLVVGLAGLTLLFWPDGMFRTPISMIPLVDWVWAGVSALVGGLTALVAHCVFLETAGVVFKAIRGSTEGDPQGSDSLLPSARE